MAIKATFVADFTSFQAAVQAAEVKLRGFEGSASKVGTALDRMVDSFSGRKVISEAALMSKAVEHIGGTSKLTEAELRRMGNVAAEAAAKLRAFGQDVPQGIQNLATHAKTATSNFDGMKAMVTSLAGAFGVVFSIGAVVNFGRAILADADALTKMHDKTGISVEGLQALRIAGDDAGVTLESMTSAINMLQKRLGGNDEGAIAALKDLGINVREFAHLDGAAQMSRLSDAVREMDDPLRVASDLSALFGKSWADQLPALKRGFQELGDGTKLMSADTVKAIDDVGDALGRLGRGLQGQGATAFAFLFLGYGKSAREAAQSTDDLSKELKKMTGEAAKLAPGFGAFKAARIPDYLDVIEKGLTKSAESSIKLTKATDDAAKKFKTEFPQSTAKVKELEGALFLIPEALGKIGKSYDDSGLIKMVDDLDRIQEKAHIANFGFRGMAEGLESLGRKFPIEEAQKFEDLMEFTGPMQQQVVVLGNTIKESLGGALASLPDVMMRAFEGGGGLLGGLKSIAVKLGADFGQTLMAGISKSVTAGGSAFNAMTAKAAAATGAMAGLGAAMSGASGKASAASAAMAGVSVAAGAIGSGATIAGSIALGAATAGIGLAAVGAYFAIKRMLNDPEKKINPIREQFVQLHGGIAALNEQAQKAGVSLTAMLNAKTPQAYKAAIDELNMALDAEAADIAALDDAIQKYGFSITELGPAMQRQMLDAQAKELLNDWRLLVGSGINLTVVNEKMAASMGDYLKTARATGAEVPASMKPILQSMIDQGMLTDEAGVKVENLEGIGVTFSETMTQGFDRIVSKLSELLDKIGLVPAAINAIPTQHTINVGYNYEAFNPPNQGDPRYAAMGGLVTATGIQHFAAGGNVLPFRPRGTDTVPAMLTPGEVVLTKAQQAKLLRGEGGGGVADLAPVVAAVLRLQEDSRRRDRMILKGIRDAVLIGKAG